MLEHADTGGGQVTSCPQCGVEAPGGAEHCPQCGSALDTAAQALIGTVVLGSYQITQVIGHGGMSVVYKARHKLTDQTVALKILPPELAVHTALRARFLEEAKALARLEHPNIIRLYNFGEEGGRFVLAMQYAEGKTFEDQIFEAGKLPWRAAVRVGIQVLKALEYAHGRGVVHRDIKPSNVLVQPDGTALVMDFGIAKMTGDSSRLTATGQTMGTVRYMSPEQVRGQSVDLRTDIYSLAVAIYEGVVGDTPFDGATHFEIMTKHLNEAPPAPRSRGADLPEALDEVLLKAMAKPPGDRFQTAETFRAALEAVLDGRPPDLGSSTAATRSVHSVTGIASSLDPAIPDEGALARRRPFLWLALGVLVLGGAAGVWALTRMSRDAAGEAAAPLAPSWLEAKLIPGLKLEVDQRFDEMKVRILATKPVDAGRLAGATAAAWKDFEAYIARRFPERRIEPWPVNVVIANGHMMCDDLLWEPNPVPGDCSRYFYRYPDRSTLYVRDGEGLEEVHLREGVALHLCMTSPDLHTLGCSDVLTPYFEAVENREAQADAGD